VKDYAAIFRQTRHQPVPTPYQKLRDGLYLLRKWSTAKGVWHFGILDVGNQIKNTHVKRGSQPIVIHQTPPTLRLEWLSETGNWELLGRIADQPFALLRIEEAAKNRTYNLFANNCQHFATYVATGVRQSPQVQIAMALLGLATLAVFA
jgi:hypothetical protein